MDSLQNTPITALSGVGQVRAKAYAKLGIRSVADLLLHYPRSYENRGDIRLLSEAEPDRKNSLLLTVATAPRSHRLRGRLSLLKFRAYDDSGVCEITFFNQDYLKNIFLPGESFRFYGKVERKGKAYTMSSPAHEPFSEEIPLPPLFSVYPLTEGLSQKQVAKDMQSALAMLRATPETDPLPEEIRTRNRLCTLRYAKRNIHAPDSYVALAAAKKRLVFDEFFTFALGLSLSSQSRKKHDAPALPDGDLSEFLSMLPFSLTEAQTRVIEEIKEDLSRPVAMSRMLVGDVGCGKTVCAAAAMYLAVKNGKQAALMAPTEILATQHYQDLSALFGSLGIRCELLTSSVPAAKKARILRELADENPSTRLPLVVGTQALLADKVAFADPALVITDEQHRFGVGQRASLSEKSRHAHVLVMSATPIPRSMALTLYGDLDMSRIDQMPAGRSRVDTFVVDESYRARLDGFIDQQIALGGQVYVVCPAVDAPDDEEGDLTLSDLDAEGNIRKGIPMHSAVPFAEELAARHPNLRCTYLHGKMKSAEKDAVMAGFAAGEIDVLVSTTVIEVGVNVPNATLMIVENAERFGLSQLHQLRGRVGRGTKKSYCVLVSDAPSDSDAAKRLSVMKNTYDGYVIAEEDLALRGPGDFLRTAEDATIRQSGGVKFRLAELCDDTGLLRTAFEEARSLLGDDPTLGSVPLLKEEVDLLFCPDSDLIS